MTYQKVFSGFAAAWLMLAFACPGYAQTPIGRLVGEQAELTADADMVRNAFEELLSYSKIEGGITLTDIGIEAVEGEYLLIGRHDKGKSALLMLRRGGELFLGKLPIGDVTTVTCQGCAYSCNPLYNRDLQNWMCTLGCGDECTKTVTVVIQKNWAENPLAPYFKDGGN